MGLFGENVRTCCNDDVLTRMKRFRSIRMNLDGPILRNCWKHTGLLVRESAPADTMEVQMCFAVERKHRQTRLKI